MLVSKRYMLDDVFFRPLDIFNWFGVYFFEQFFERSVFFCCYDFNGDIVFLRYIYFLNLAVYQPVFEVAVAS